jgi:hypothetical protein
LVLHDPETTGLKLGDPGVDRLRESLHFYNLGEHASSFKRDLPGQRQ